MKSFLLYISLSVMGLCKGFGQTNNDTLLLSLQQVVAMAKSTSIASRQAATTRETKYWEYRTFKSNY